MDKAQSTLYETIQALERNGTMYFYILSKDLRLRVATTFPIGDGGLARFIREHYLEIHEIIHTTRRHVGTACVESWKTFPNRHGHLSFYPYD